MDSVNEILNAIFFENTVLQYLSFFGCVIAGIIVGKIVYFFFKNHLRKLAAKSSSQFDDYLIDITEEPLVMAIFTCGIWVGQNFLTLNATAQQLMNNIVFVLIAITIAWFILRFIEMLLTKYVAPLVEKSDSKLDDQILPILRKAAKGVVIIMTIIIVMANLGYDILSLLAGLGIGGLALALAAQDAVKNIIGGFSIFWDKPFQIDDFIELSGEKGTVKEVGLRSTRLNTIDGTTVVIPNSTVANTIIENFASRKRRRVNLAIGLVYETTADQMDEAIKIIEDTIKSVDGTDSDDIIVRFTNFGAFSLDLDIVYWIVDMANWKPIIHNVNMGLKRNLDNAGMDMAFPTETHYVVNQNGSASS